MNASGGALRWRSGCRDRDDGEDRRQRHPMNASCFPYGTSTEMAVGLCIGAVAAGIVAGGIP